MDIFILIRLNMPVTVHESPVPYVAVRDLGFAVELSSVIDC